MCVRIVSCVGAGPFFWTAPPSKESYQIKDKVIPLQARCGPEGG